MLIYIPHTLQVIRDLKWTRAADVYSFGVVWYEVFARGALPFHSIPDEVLIRRLFAAVEGGGTSVAQLLFDPLACSLPAPLCVFIWGFVFFLILISGLYLRISAFSWLARWWTPPPVRGPRLVRCLLR